MGCTPWWDSALNSRRGSPTWTIISTPIWGGTIVKIEIDPLHFTRASIYIYIYNYIYKYIYIHTHTIVILNTPNFGHTFIIARPAGWPLGPPSTPLPTGPRIFSWKNDHFPHGKHHDWWLTYPSEKWWSSSVSLDWFWWENLNRKPWFLPSNLMGFPVNFPIIQFYDSWDDELRNWRESHKIHVPNHQPDDMFTFFWSKNTIG